MNLRKLTVCALFPVWCFLFCDIQAAIIHVPGDQNSIQEGIDAAMAGDTVLVAPGTYTERINFNGKAIDVIGSEGPENTIIDGQSGGSVVTFNSGEIHSSRLMGFSIIGGTGSDYMSNLVGGGILVLDSSPVIENNIIRNNHLTGEDLREGQHVFGGGIFLENSLSILRGNQIRENTIQGGNATIYYDGTGGDAFGGGLAVLYSEIQLAGNILEENICEGGRAMYNDEDPYNVTTIGGSASGGGVYVSNGSMQSSGDIICGNLCKGGNSSASCDYSGFVYGIAGDTFGGGFCLTDIGTLVIEDAVVSGNNCMGGNGTAISDGGYEYAYGGDAQGGGIFLSSATTQFILNRSIVENNQCQSGTGEYFGFCCEKANGNSRGGGCFSDSAGFLDSCYFRSNSCSTSSPVSGEPEIHGGGLYLMGYSNQIINTFLGDNQVSGTDSEGSAIYGGNQCSIDHSTIAWNSGAPAIQGGTGTVLINSIVYFNDDPGIFTGNFCNVEGGLPGEGNLDTDPLFLTESDPHISETSSCVDRGMDIGIDHDIDGETRPAGSGVDIGADETGSFLPTPTPVPTIPDPQVVIDLSLSSELFTPGDSFILTVSVTNSTDHVLFDMPFVLLLEIYSDYYWFPVWDGNFHYESFHIGFHPLEIGVFDFIWPDVSGHAEGLKFYGAILKRDMTAIYGKWDWVEFGWDSQ